MKIYVAIKGNMESNTQLNIINKKANNFL